jgi:hypothetical protein
MKSSNDIYHGDEHITDKPQKFKVKASEVVHYEVEVEAYSEEEAYDLATEEITKDGINVERIYDTSSFQYDSCTEVNDVPERDYNFSYGGTD